MIVRVNTIMEFDRDHLFHTCKPLQNEKVTKRICYLCVDKVESALLDGQRRAVDFEE